MYVGLLSLGGYRGFTGGLHRELQTTLKWGELSPKSGRVVLVRVLCGASCLGASCLWGELS